MDLVRDVLDTRIVDRNGRDIGRADRLVLQVEEHGQPRLIAVEVGPSILADRISPFLGRLAAALERAFDLDRGRPFRIPIGAVREFSDPMTVDLAFGETPAATLEHRLRRWLGAIPGSS